MCLTSVSSLHELVGTVGAIIFDGLSDEDKKDFQFLFTIINSDNSYWHLVVVDMQKKIFMHLNSLKRNVRYKANAKNWQKLLGLMCHIYCDNEEVTN